MRFGGTEGIAAVICHRAWPGWQTLACGLGHRQNQNVLTLKSGCRLSTKSRTARQFSSETRTGTRRRAERELVTGTAAQQAQMELQRGAVEGLLKTLWSLGHSE
jgi:hypothetical protein